MHKIKRMEINSYNAIINLWKNTEGIGINDYDDSKKSIRKFLEKNPNTCFVAELDSGEIIGTIMGGNDGRRGLIYHLMVKNEYRKSGIGRKLLKKVENGFKKEGIKKIYLTVFKSNKIGNKFWEINNYEIRSNIAYRSKQIGE